MCIRDSLGGISLLSPEYLLSVERWPFHSEPPDVYKRQEIQGEAAPGTSSGDAMALMENLASKLPAGIGYDWTGMSYQELSLIHILN